MLLKLENIRKSYGNQNVLKGVRLEMDKGKMTAIIGKSGCGKTTLLNVLSGTDCFEGDYFFEDELINCQDERQLEHLRRDKVSRIFQDYQLLDHLNCLQNVLLPARYGKKDGKRADEIFETIGLQGYQRRRINDLSGGEKQRIAIGRCLMSGNPLILADEPTGSLDSANAMMIMNLLRQMCLSGYSVIVVTHDKEVAGLCDGVLELKDGVIYQ